jgi:hypothetical protein
MNRKYLAWLFAIAAILRLGFIWIAPAWYDENFTLILSRLPMAHMLAATAGDTHPPLYYLLVWPLGQLHAPIWILRIPSAMLSLAAMRIFWHILEALELRPRVRMAALVLMAIMPIQLYYAQEARMYSLLEFLVLAACLAMLRKRWGWFGLACALMLYTQYYAIFYIATLGLVALIRNNHEEWRKIFLAGALAGLAFLPWAIVLQGQMHNIQGQYWMQLTGMGMLPRVLFVNLFMPPGNAVIQIPLMLVCFAWIFAALLYALLHRSENLGTLLWLAFLPFGLAILVSLVWQPVLHYRPLIGISPFLYILLAGPVDQLFFQFARSSKFYLYGFHGINLRKALLAAIFIIPLLLVSDGSMYIYARENKTSDAIIALSYIQAHWQPGDIIYHFADDSWVNTFPYFSLPSYKAPDCGVTLGALSPATRQAIGEQIIPLDNLIYKRAWLLWSDSPLTPTCSDSQLISLGLNPKKPLLITASDEYYFDGLWLLEHK